MRILETTVCSPTSVEEAWAIRESYDGSAKFIAGGTFLQTKWEKGIALPSQIIHLGEIQEYKQIYLSTQGQIHIGSFVKLGKCKSHPLITEKLPQLSQAIKKIAAPAVRNLGTIGGNIANRVGDTIPLLLALDAEILYINKNGRQQNRLEDWLQMIDDSLILEIIIPYLIEANPYIFSRKIGRREAFSPSVVTLAGVFMTKENQLTCRLAAGGGETLPSRLRQTEIGLQQAHLIDSVVINMACKSLMKEYQPVEDTFYSGDYRQRVASNLLNLELENWRGAYGGL